MMNSERIARKVVAAHLADVSGQEAAAKALLAGGPYAPRSRTAELMEVAQAAIVETLRNVARQARREDAGRALVRSHRDQARG